MVGYCTRKAVTDALIKQEPIWACRTVIDRLKERHLSLEKLSVELSKIQGLAVNANGLADILNKNPLALVYLLAAAKLDDDVNKDLIPVGIERFTELSKNFGLHSQDCSTLPGYDKVDLPPFLKNALIKTVKNSYL
jgi:hypothetical protein